MRWLDAVSGKFYYQDLLDLLKSPFVLADWPAGDIKQAVYELEHWCAATAWCRTWNITCGWPRKKAAAKPAGPAATAGQRACRFAAGRGTLAGWLRALQESLSILGVIEGLKKRCSRRAAIGIARTPASRTGGESALFSLAEWRQWLNRQLEVATFRDESITAPLC